MLPGGAGPSRTPLRPCRAVVIQSSLTSQIWQSAQRHKPQTWPSCRSYVDGALLKSDCREYCAVTTNTTACMSGSAARMRRSPEASGLLRGIRAAAASAVACSPAPAFHSLPGRMAVLFRSSRGHVPVDQLSDSEQLLWDACQQSQTADLRAGDVLADDPLRGTSWGGERVVQASPKMIRPWLGNTCWLYDKYLGKIRP